MVSIEVRSMAVSTCVKGLDLTFRISLKCGLQERIKAVRFLKV